MKPKVSGLDELIYVEQELLPSETQVLDGFDPKYRSIVDYIIGITYDIWEQKGIGEIRGTYAEDVYMHLGLATYRGRDRVIDGTLDTLQAFPDRVPYGEEVIWSRAKGNKFFSSHRLGSTATHRGAHAIYGSPTGRKIFFRAIADCTIANNRVDEEWLIRDNYHILLQLGLDPVGLAKRLNPYTESIQDRRRLRSENLIPRYDIGDYTPSAYNGDPSAALVLSLFKEVYHGNFFNRLDEYYAETALIDSICEHRYGGIAQIRDYLLSIFASIPRADVILDRITCNRGRVDKVAVRWTMKGVHRHHGLFGPPSGRSVYVVGITHFEVSQGKIRRQWEVFDYFDVLCQIHAQDRERAVPSRNAENKRRVRAFVAAMNHRGATGSGCDPMTTLARFLSDDFVCNASAPFHEMRGIEAYHAEFQTPLLHAFPDMEDRPYLVMGGRCDGKECVSMAGNFIGTFERAWLGIPPSRQCVWIRYQSHMLLEGEKIVKAWYLLDILDVMRQAGFDLFPSRGAGLVVPPPMSGDGVITYPVDAKETAKTQRLVSEMLSALLAYDGEDYASMGDLGRYWDQKDMLWYGPAGIGSTKGLNGFQKYHQFPFLTAFPNRGIIAKDDSDHFASYAEGHYACDFGFPAMYATHTGNGWLGLDAGGRECTMRVMDFWRRAGDRLKENWVMIDIIDILAQLGVDVFALLRDAVREDARQT